MTGWMSRDEIVRHLEGKLGLVEVPSAKTGKPLQHAARYKNLGRTFYVKRDETRPLVVHPDWLTNIKANPVAGVEFDGGYYMNSALSGFPKLNGRDQSPCGAHLNVRDIRALEAVLVRIGAIHAPAVAPSAVLTLTQAMVSTATKPAPSSPPVLTSAGTPPASGLPGPLADLAEAEAKGELDGLTPTERDAVVKARLGQGRFRADLLAAWGGQCAVTGIGIPALLRASHIKPWRDSNNTERLDRHNGLLLVANLDAAFDAGLITFQDDGSMTASSMLGAHPEEALGIPPGGARLRRAPSPEQRAFLQYHRRVTAKGS